MTFSEFFFNQAIGIRLAIGVGITRQGGRHDQKKTRNLFNLRAFYKMRIANGGLFNGRHPIL